MANLHLVTGYAGHEHITALDQAAFNAALIGTGQFVLDKGKALEAQVISNNQIRILDGELMMQGRFVRLDPDTYVDLPIENGAQGMKRNDLIVARYTKDAVTGIEGCNLVVIKGTPTENNPADPAYTSGDIISGNVLLNDMPLYRVPLNGLNVQELVPMFAVHDITILSLDESKVPKTRTINGKPLSEDVTLKPKDIGAASADAVYTKEQTLTNTTKAQFGLGSEAVPDSVLMAARTLIDGANKNADSKAKFAIGSYVGTGEFGSNTAKNTLTLPFEPTLLFLFNNDGYCTIIPKGASHVTATLKLGHVAVWEIAFDGASVSWYATSWQYISSGGQSETNVNSPSQQYNGLGVTYQYIAIG